jgi:NADH dehydrogenase FAD-containing subunit
VELMTDYDVVDTMTAPNNRKHVVVVGGGFAGVGFVRQLARRDEVRVTLVDRNNYHQFQPMLYQVATSQLAPSDISFSLRKLFRDRPNVDVKLAEVASVDPASRTVTASDGQSWTGDAVVLAAGSMPNFFRTPERTGTRSPCTRSTRRRGCDRASWACSRTPTAAPRWWSAAR